MYIIVYIYPLIPFYFIIGAQYECLEVQIQFQLDIQPYIYIYSQYFIEIATIFQWPFQESKLEVPIIYSLWLFNIAMEAMAHRKFDGLPKFIAWWIFPWQTVSRNQMVSSVQGLCKGISP